MLKIQAEIKDILHTTQDFVREIKAFFKVGIEDIKDSQSLVEGVQVGVYLLIQSILALCFAGLFLAWLAGYFGLILIHILKKPISQLYKLALRIWEKANSFMPLPTHAPEAVVYCVANILSQHPSDFPVAGNGGETAKLITASVQQRPGFNYIKLDVVKQNSAPLNETEVERLKLLLQRYINSLLSLNLVDGIPQQYSVGGFPFLYVDEVQDIGSTLQIDVLWVGHKNVEGYIRS